MYSSWGDRRKLVIFTETELTGAFVIDLERREDNRGFFARTFCQHEFDEHGLKPVIAQANVAFNRRKGTLRGMHFQFPPAAETKLVRCTRGAILDIIVDLRPESPTYLEHVAVELSADNHRALYVPERFAHGYQVLEDSTETSYQVGEFYTPEAEGGLRFDDPRLGLTWPLPVTEISDKDRAWALLDEIEAELSRKMRSLTASLMTARRLMIIVDNALQAREASGRPIRVGMVGAGFMGQGLANQIVNSVPGMRLAAIYNRQPRPRRPRVTATPDSTTSSTASAANEFEDAIRAGRPVVDRGRRSCSAAREQIDVLVDVTGSVEFGAHVVLEAFAHGKHVVLMNAEVDATIGPILQVYAQKHGRDLCRPATATSRACR